MGYLLFRYTNEENKNNVKMFKSGKWWFAICKNASYVKELEAVGKRLWVSCWFTGKVVDTATERTRQNHIIPPFEIWKNCRRRSMIAYDQIMQSV